MHERRAILRIFKEASFVEPKYRQASLPYGGMNVEFYRESGGKE
jgi:hypothetical protein